MSNEVKTLIKSHLELLNKELKRLNRLEYTDSVIAKIHYIGLVKKRLNVMLGECTVDEVMAMQQEENEFLEDVYESGIYLSGYLQELILNG